MIPPYTYAKRPEDVCWCLNNHIRITIHYSVKPDKSKVRVIVLLHVFNHNANPITVSNMVSFHMYA